MTLTSNRTQRFLSFCGVIAPLVFVFTAILGGALRPGYSHLSNTVSELFSPGSPNKLLLDFLHTLFALLLTSFGIGLLKFFQVQEEFKRLGITGAVLFTAAGGLSVTTATIFPQDPWGTPPTFPGQMHIYVSGVLSILTMGAMVLIGIWFNKAGVYPGFGTYSFITVGATLLSAAYFTSKFGSPEMGLAERITILVGFQWTFTLAWWIVSNERTFAVD